jgi:alpha-aminoadipate/glutamate carrier protein LysW
MTKIEGRMVTKMTNCAECDANIPVPKDALEGEIVTCPDCGASFELVKNQDGFDLKPAQTVGEDWGQ